MSSQATKVIADALKLDPEERAEIIEELVRSLDQGGELDADDRERLHEALRRSDEQFKARAALPAREVQDRFRKR